MKNITDVKNYWDSRPCNVKHSQSRKGTKKYFDEVENKKYFVEPHIPEFAEFEKWKGEGKYVVYADDKPNDRFKFYSDVDQSWQDHSNLLTKPRYNHLRSLSKFNYESWAYGLKSAGYATDPNYAQKLISIIEKYKLWRYDINPLNW